MSTKTAEATFLFPAMIEEVIGPTQTIGSTFEQPIERSHNLGKQKVSRRSMCGGGHKDPHLYRESGLRRTMGETAIQKKGKRASKEEIQLALVNAKKSKNDPDVIEVETDPVIQEEETPEQYPVIGRPMDVPSAVDYPRDDMVSSVVTSILNDMVSSVYIECTDTYIQTCECMLNVSNHNYISIYMYIGRTRR